ncbi:hypothetical protein L1987_49471 [Smallanthus sonchifolius]|uniref:Uncharacterized protein n=1 Tax=Smallanthus sonchifolius TaxID=185202 RepID=A0ACB9FU81_9ASTR|nr:hypothetical protein L1987_49471 [Smallanthus sonchifolius]
MKLPFATAATAVSTMPTSSPTNTLVSPSTLPPINPLSAISVRAFLFCKEDRAILCKACDISIHEANEHTQYHSRFLLAGVKLSKSSSCFDALCSSNGSSEIDKDENLRAFMNSTSCCEGVSQEDGVSMEASSISEYLIQTLPGWHVEEVLNASGSHPNGFSEGYDRGTCTLPFMAHDSDSNGDLGSFWSEEDLGNLVNSSSAMVMDHQISRTSSLSQRFFFNEVENLEKVHKDQYIFNPSTFKRPRQPW